MRMRQDIGQVDFKTGESSSKSNIVLDPKVTQQTKLSFMYSNKVYTCSVFNAYLWQNPIQ